MCDNLLVKHYAGSIAYGTNLPTSDVDFRGIFCADPINIRTPFFRIFESTDVNEEDTKLYELTKFIQLCADCNPNIIETLWVDDSDITFRTPAYDILRENRTLMLSSKIAFTTSGYAISQLKRIKGHNKWINNPQPIEPPVPVEFVSLVQWFGHNKVLPREFDIAEWRDDCRLIPYGSNLYGLHCDWSSVGFQTSSDDGNLNATYEGDRSELPPPLALLKFNKEEYLLAKEKHSQYWEWKNNRNEKRSELEEKYGYDTKHAMHLVRLLRMGVEALRDGVILVKRQDAQELLDIRNGSLTYEEIVEYAEVMDKEVRDVWYHKTELPKKPDLKKVAKLLMDTQDLVWGK